MWRSVDVERLSVDPARLPPRRSSNGRSHDATPRSPNHTHTHIRTNTSHTKIHEMMVGLASWFLPSPLCLAGWLTSWQRRRHESCTMRASRNTACACDQRRFSRRHALRLHGDGLRNSRKHSGQAKREQLRPARFILHRSTRRGRQQERTDCNNTSDLRAWLLHACFAVLAAVPAWLDR